MNFKPALPCANVMKLPLVMGVVPSLRKSEPFAIAVILKWVTSGPSTALREITSPDVVCVLGLVLALVTPGVSATGVTVIVNVRVNVSRHRCRSAIVLTVTVMTCGSKLVGDWRVRE